MNQLLRRKIITIRCQKKLPCCSRMHYTCSDQLNQVIQGDHAALIIQASKRQRYPFFNYSQQPGEIARSINPIDKRWTNDHQFCLGTRKETLQPLLSLKL
ncbi:hypothetical protein D9M68_773410 [compost metagenome]